MRVEQYADCVNKFCQIVALETWMWRQIVTSHTAYVPQQWLPYATAQYQGRSQDFSKGGAEVMETKAL